MIVPSKNQKTYGVIHTENYFSFLGFCKKVNSNEIQKVDIFLNDTLIDTIIADKHIEIIEDIYELEGFGFNYVLPNEYIGQKNLISFKNHETQENLQNSPYELIDESHPKFNEMAFSNSLVNPIIKEKNKDLSCPNTIGFLATEENLKDEEFVKYIGQLVKDFHNNKFKAFIFDDSLNSNLSSIFKNIDIIKISNFHQLFDKVEVYLSNNDRNELDTRILMSLYKNAKILYPLALNINEQTSLVNYERINMSYFAKFFDNLEYLGFNQSDIFEFGKTFHEVYFKKNFNVYNIDIDFNLNETVSKAYVYWQLKLGFHNNKFFEDSRDFAKKFSEL